MEKDIKGKLGKVKNFAPMLSAVLVGTCVVSSLSGYKAPVFAEEQETDGTGQDTKTEDAKKANTAKGSFDLTDGVYQGTGTGYAGDITVAVQIKNKQIVSIDILSESDDDAFFSRAKAVIDRILDKQSLDVDTVSGATFSSKGIISAVKNALTGEKDSGETGASQSGNTAAAGSSKTVETVADAASYKDGTYYGTGTGFGGELKVKVVISGGKITSIDIVETSDGSSYISKASGVISSILSSQSTNVDTVSGATYSSVGIIQAVRAALVQAAVTDSSSGSGSSSTGNNNSSNNSGAIKGTVPYIDGIYRGTAEGYNGNVSVDVVIQDKTIKAILVADTSDDEQFFNRAMTVLKNILKKQNTDVDTVSGATYSSKGLLNAVKNALKEAERATKGEKPEVQKPDVTALEQKIAEAEALDEEVYTEKSWSALQVRLQDAKEALESESQTEVDKAVDNLQKAMNALEKKEEDPESVYKDGAYTVTVPCYPDEDEDFDQYNLTLTVTIRDDKIVGITDVSGDGGSGNNRYIKYAAVSGNKGTESVVTQVVNKGTLDGIDAVSGATCTSNSILEGCKLALEKAKR